MMKASYGPVRAGFGPMRTGLGAMSGGAQLGVLAVAGVLGFFGGRLAGGKSWQWGWALAAVGGTAVLMSRPQNA